MPAAERVFSHEAHQKQTDRPLRIGYVSGDFGTHPVGFLLRDVARYHDCSQFNIHCYSMMRGSDMITEVSSGEPSVSPVFCFLSVVCKLLIYSSHEAQV